MKANLFTHCEEEDAARPGMEDALQQASHSFFTQLDRLVMLQYIGATSKTDISAVEAEIELSLTSAMQHWFNACNPDAVFPEGQEPTALAASIVHDAPRAIGKAMRDVLREKGIITDDPSPVIGRT